MAKGKNSRVKSKVKKTVEAKVKAKKNAPVKAKVREKTPPWKIKKAGTRGCGRWIGSCGGHHAGTVSISGTCACGRRFSRSCSNSDCSGVSWYC
jgi:hypothetical protein